MSASSSTPGVYLEQLPSQRWRAAFRAPRTGKKRSATFDTPQEAEQWGATELARLRRQAQPEPGDLLGTAMAHLRAAMVLLEAIEAQA